jgi:hypothetical protein
VTRGNIAERVIARPHGADGMVAFAFERVGSGVVLLHEFKRPLDVVST